MSARSMTKQCSHCRRTFTYNPSVGDFGTICKYCHKPQITAVTIEPYPGGKSAGNLSGIKKFF